MRTFTLGFCLLALAALNLPAQAREQSQTVKSGLQWTWSCQFPTQTPAPTASQQEFDLYSWQMFVALNWPAQAGQRGQPDCSQSIGTMGPVVWQTYKTVDQIFLPGAVNPRPWNTAQGESNLNMINIVALKNTNVVHSVDQAVGGWLIDQRGNPTYYAIHANEISYGYIVNNNFYNANVVAKANDIDFPDLCRWFANRFWQHARIADPP
jgi:hypothetical protein